MNLGTNFVDASLRMTESVSMGTQLHRLLRAAIIRNELAPGQAISEVEMSKRFAISRQPVREAFIKLNEERLIEILPQRGTYVRKISVKEALDGRHLREIIEVSIVRELTQTHNDELIRELRRIVHLQSQVAHADRGSFLALDEEFHKCLALAAGREYAWRVTESIKAQMNRVRFLSFDLTTPIPELVAEHSDVIDAIACKDPDLAAQRMETHMRGLLSSLPLIAQTFPEHFTEE